MPEHAFLNLHLENVNACEFVFFQKWTDKESSVIHKETVYGTGRVLELRVSKISLRRGLYLGSQLSPLLLNDSPTMAPILENIGGGGKDSFSL